MMPLAVASQLSTSAERMLPESGSPSAEDNEVREGVWLDREWRLPSLSWLLDLMLLPSPFLDPLRSIGGSGGGFIPGGPAAAFGPGSSGRGGGGRAIRLG